MNRPKHTTRDDAADARESSTSVTSPRALPLLYASDVRVVVDPGDVRLIFTRFVPPMSEVENAEESRDPESPVNEVIVRVELPRSDVSGCCPGGLILSVSLPMHMPVQLIAPPVPPA